MFIAQSFPQPNMGAIRLRRVARYLPDCGYEPIVLTADMGLPMTKGTTILNAKAMDLTKLYRHWRSGIQPPPNPVRTVPIKKITFTSFLNRWFMIPDKQVTWRRPAIKMAREYLHHHKVDLIFASLEPRTNLLVAAQLAREFRIPCVMEYRDLWTRSPYYHLAQPTGFHRWLHSRLERNVLEKATRVTCVSRGLAAYLQKEYPANISSKIALNYNFFDPAEYPVSKGGFGDGCSPFIVSYVGAMYMSRGPSAFLSGLRLFVDREKLSPRDVRFCWVGVVAGINNVRQMIESLGLSEYIDAQGQVPHDEALKLLCKSHLALILQSPDDLIHIPGKLFEAMGARVPVLLLSNPCEVAEIVERTHAGRVCPHDSETVSMVLAELWQRHRQGFRWEFNNPEMEEFSASRSVARLARLFDEAIGTTC